MAVTKMEIKAVQSGIQKYLDANSKAAVKVKPPAIRERDVERYLVEQVKLQGGEVRKLQWIGRRGAPDRAVFLHGTHLVELKRPGEVLRPEQAREHARLRKTGARVYTLSSYFQVDTFLDRLAQGRAS